MITITEEAKELFREIDNPENTVLRIDPVTTNEMAGETRVRLSIGEPRNDDQVILHEGEDLVRIARPVSEALNGSTIDLVETLEGPALSLKPPDDGLPLTDGS
ncbi:MAG: hypothetical protein AVDCRST_MAG28-3805 [uncultured Rubrobacteraceae bacterium]|uniref:Uncharacterized protein n=1 Tax=uncultured Rubrobacteraceae bacterium TaxID=349277 RepID=A0A6J4R474_9ACTN|nr:MAG: hypothetical protein AVDCRST_MAG28-3805 [uncultured Rubrobacteraceae bacterium]